MRMYLKEKIGDPELFTGRRQELTFFLTWVEGVKREHSKSMAMLSRRKTGKTALLQRLYNLIFEQNDAVVPFYYEMTEGNKWAVDFCCEFFLTFIYQFLAFQTRNISYLTYSGSRDFDQAHALAEQEGVDVLVGWIDSTAKLARAERVDLLWSQVRDAPRKIAEQADVRVVQMIDEFQYLNSEIYWDQAKTNQATDFAAGYMSTAEYRNAPLLIAGSWVGWLRHLLMTMLPSRFKKYFLDTLSEAETLEMIFNYAQVLGVPVTEETAHILASLSEGNPFYLSALFYSACPNKDFTQREGVLQTLAYETLDDRGDIKATWMEYINVTFSKVNERHAKNIVLYLCKHRDREVTRQELLDTLQLEMTDLELEQKLHALVKSDIIEAGRTNFDYRGVQDNIFDKVFRGVYQKEIEAFDPAAITNEYQALFEAAQRKYHELLGKYNYTKGLYAEYALINQLRFHAYHRSDEFRATCHNVPADFRFVKYDSVWSYNTIQPNQPTLHADILARASQADYTLIGEVKNRDTKKFSVEEAEEFLKRAAAVQEREQVASAVLFVYSLTGFTQEALDYFQSHQIDWSEDRRWLE